MRKQDLSRRSVLSGAAVVGAASLLVRSRKAPAVGEAEGTTPITGEAEGSAPGRAGIAGTKKGDSAATGPGSITTTGLKGLVGATVSSFALGTGTWTEAVHKFDAKVRRPMAASASRMYFTGPTLDSGHNAGLVQDFAAAGVTAVISFRPSRAQSTSEIAKLQRSIQQCQDAGLKIEAICLWHEPNDITRQPQEFRTGLEYVDYVRYYGPAVVEMGVPLCYIPLVLTSVGSLQDSYFPGTAWRGKTLVTRIYPDFYCASQYIHGARMDASVSLADEYGLRLGIGEFGRTNCQTKPSDSEFAAYLRYLRGIYAGRQDRASCMYWSDGPLNYPNSSAAAELEAFYDALT